ncbi:unnamed protein product [Lepidochelys kempii]
MRSSLWTAWWGGTERSEGLWSCGAASFRSWIIQITSSGSNGEVTEQTMMMFQADRSHWPPGTGQKGVFSLAEITQKIENFDTQQGPGEDSLSYTFSEGQLANRTALGTTLNILCSDIPIYWAGSSQKQQRRWSIYVHFWGITIYIGFGRSSVLPFLKY